MDDALTPGAPFSAPKDPNAAQKAPTSPMALADLLTPPEPLPGKTASAEINPPVLATGSKSSMFYLSRRALNRIFLSALGVLSLIAALIFKATISPAQDLNPLISTERGQVAVSGSMNFTLNISDEPRTLSPATIITTADESSAILSFPQSSEIRIKPETILQLEQIDDSPVVILNSGAIWVSALQKVELKMAAYRFQIAAGSASFILQNDKLVVSAWDNNLPMRIQMNDAEEFAFTVPALGSAVFPKDPQHFFGGDTLQKLRFSKLQKEFHMTHAMAASEEKYELRRDADLQKYAADFLLSSPASGQKFFARLASLLSFFPEQKAEDRYRDENTRAQELYLAAAANDRARITMLLQSDFSNMFLEKLAADIAVLEAFLPQKTLRAEIEDRMLSASGANTARSEVFLRNAFHGLQKALSTGNQAWRDIELKRIRLLWKRIQEDQKSAVKMLVPTQRETIFYLLLEYPAAASGEILSFAEELDSIAIELAPEEEKNLVRQENIDRKLATAKALIQVKLLPLARSLAEQAQGQLTELQRNAPSESLVNLLKQQENIMLRLYACSFNDTCLDPEFTTWYQTKKLSACQLFAACTPEAFVRWLQDLLSGKVAMEQNDPEALPANDFAAAQALLKAADISLEKGRAGEESFFLIEKAITKNGIIFSGELAIEDAYLKNVQLLTGGAVPGTIALDSLTAVLTRAEQPDDLVTPSVPNSSGVPLSPLDPVLSDLTIRTLQPDLLSAGFVVLRSDMIPESTSLVHVLQAVVGTEEIALSFDYRINKENRARTIEQIKLQEFPEIVLPDLPLETAPEEIIRSFSAAKSALNLRETAWQLFNTAGFLIEKTNITMSAKANTVHFEALQDLHHGFVFTGEFAVTERLFLLLADARKNWQRTNIPLDEYPQLFAPDETPQEMRNISPDSQSDAEAALEEEEAK